MQVGAGFRQLGREIDRRQLRIVDLVRQLDTDKDGCISSRELELGCLFHVDVMIVCI